MDAAQAISLAVRRIFSEEPAYPTEGLMAEGYDGGWCVYAPAVIELDDPMVVSDVPRPSVFLVDGSTGTIYEVEDPDPESVAEACVWTAGTSGATSHGTASRLPPFPDPWGPRRATDLDYQALGALARALTRERDFGAWLAWQLACLAKLLGGSHGLVARRHDPECDDQVKELADSWLETDDGPSGIWKNWPALNLANLPEADTTGWLLTALGSAGGWLDAIGAEADPAVMNLAGTVYHEFQRIPRWRACGVVEFYPQLIALRLHGQLAVDMDEVRRLALERPGDDSVSAFLALLPAPSPDDADVEGLLRLAVDAERGRRDVIDLDATAAAAYRRVLDRLGLPLDAGVED